MHNPSPGCNAALADKPGRTGMYALNFPHPPDDHVTSEFPGTYGDVRAVPSAQSGRTPIDAPYRNSVVALDARARSVVHGNLGNPPGCTTVTDSSCTGTDGTWLVLRQADCNSLDTFFSPVLFPLRAVAPRILFNCDLTVSPSASLPSGLILSAPSAFVVITGSLSVTSTFAITDPSQLFIGGRATGNRVANVYLSAQFISRTMVVTGGAVVNLVLNPFDTVPLIVYELVAGALNAPASPWSKRGSATHQVEGRCADSHH